ncbi:hypothetical protein GCM10029978_016250 [Actinoallomurus acanthiterrae]
MTVAQGHEPEQYWHLQDAEQRFDEVVRRAQGKGPQIIAHGETEAVVVVDIAAYRRMQRRKMTFHEFLLAGPPFPDDFDRLIERDDDPGRDVCSWLEE